MSSMWVNQSQGLMIVDDDFLMSHLKVDQIEYVALAEKTCPTGIYVTDYFADAILVQKSSYKSYNDFVGKYAQIGRLRNGTVYVNGIIKTDYKNKISGLLDEFGKGEENSAILQSQYESELEYLSYALNFVYTQNKDFMEDLKSDTNTMPLLFLPHGSFSSSATGWKATTTSYQTGYSSLLKKGGRSFSRKMRPRKYSKWAIITNWPTSSTRATMKADSPSHWGRFPKKTAPR